MHSTGTCLADRLKTALRSNPHLTGRKLAYETDAGFVVLKGTVNSFFQKQMAQKPFGRG